MGEYTEVIFRTVVVYSFIITGLRILGRQHLGQLTINDFVLVLLISNAVHNAMFGSNTSLSGGIIAAVTLLIINYLLSLLIFKSTPIRRLLSGEQVVLIYNGHYQEHNLQRFQITHD